MRASLLILAASLCYNPLAAEAQALLASNTPPAPERFAAADAPTVIVAGLITSPNGPLPGAVVTLTATRQMAVTNSEGEFQFTVPAGSRVLKAVVSYAGYADEALSLNVEDAEPTANLSDVRAIVMPRRQQLKFYLRTARKETHRQLRQLHKNTR